MRNNEILLKDLTKGKQYNIEFQLTPDMVKGFTDLSGDYSSLHTDRAFGRRSIYRKNVIHGMLPVIFISGLKPCHLKGFVSSFSKISARFLRPLFVDDRLLLNAKAVDIKDEGRQVEFEYILKKLETGTPLTTGNFILRYSRLDKSQLYRSRVSGFNQCLVIDSLVEEALQFEQISAGDERSLQFLISKVHAHRLYGILKRGLLSDYKIRSAEYFSSCNLADLLSSCLFSTFVGMCLPGRYATLMDFNLIFHKPIQWNKKYRLTGKVDFKSESTATLVENILIGNPDGNTEPLATGKVNVRVNEALIEMPSVEFLKNNELDLGLKGKVVLITGASRGIGETTAKLFSLYGAKVAVNYFQGKDDAKRVVDEIIKSGGTAVAVQADVSDRQQVREMISTVRRKYGTLHILVNNAVRDAYPTPFMELIWDDFQKDIDVTVKGAFNCCQEALSLMIENREGKIINISTVFVDNPVSEQAKYIVSKSALVGLTRSLAVEFAPYNIQVNLVEPSIVKTDLSKHVSKIFFENMRKATPMKRNATAQDVAKAIVFLASSLSSFTTGQKIVVTGGNPPFL